MLPVSQTLYRYRVWTELSVTDPSIIRKNGGLGCPPPPPLVYVVAADDTAIGGGDGVCVCGVGGSGRIDRFPKL